MTDEEKNECFEEQKAPKRRPSSNEAKPESLNIDDIPVPVDEETPSTKTHKVVRVVEVNRQSAAAPAPEQKPAAKKKSGFLGEFFSGAAAGAKEVGESISAGLKSVTEKKETEKPVSRAESFESTVTGLDAAAFAEAKAAAEKERAAKLAAEKKAEEKRLNAEHDATFMPDIDIGDSSVSKTPAAKPAPAEPKPEQPVRKETQQAQPVRKEIKPTAEPVRREPVASEPEKTGKTRPRKAAEVSDNFMDSFKNLPIGVVLGGAAAIIVVLVLIIVLATSCNKQPGSGNNSGSSSGSSSIGISQEVSETETDKPLEIKSALSGIADAYNVNNDVVGWLYIPGLSDIDSAVCQDTTSYSYNKRDVTGKYVKSTYWIDGAYYAHKRALFGDSIDGISKNTVIFGHSDLGTTNLDLKDDDPTGPLFSQLFNFKDPSFAEKTPYIFFSTADADYVWEVFAVFYNDKTVDGDLWYIEPSPSKADYQNLIDTAKKRSLYNYDVDVTTSDHILTLSTCTVGFGYSTRANYRFVIMAKLVEDTEGLLQKNASIVLNSDAPIPSTFKSTFEGYVANWKPAESGTSSSSSLSTSTSASSNSTSTSSSSASSSK